LPRLLSVWKHWYWWQAEGRPPLFDALTWRLWGSLPAKAEAVPHPTPGHAFAADDRELDRRNSGPLWLKDTRIAELVSRTILGDYERRYYDLCAWVVMPNRLPVAQT
jgi:hypothetical protein